MHILFIQVVLLTWTAITTNLTTNVPGSPPHFSQCSIKVELIYFFPVENSSMADYFTCWLKPIFLSTSIMPLLVCIPLWPLMPEFMVYFHLSSGEIGQLLVLPEATLVLSQGLLTCCYLHLECFSFHFIWLYPPKSYGSKYKCPFLTEVFPDPLNL